MFHYTNCTMANETLAIVKILSSTLRKWQKTGFLLISTNQAIDDYSDENSHVQI